MLQYWGRIALRKRLVCQPYFQNILYHMYQFGFPFLFCWHEIFSKNAFYTTLHSLQCLPFPVSPIPSTIHPLQTPVFHTLLTQCVHLIRGILYRTRQEEQMSLSTEIKNHLLWQLYKQRCQPDCGRQMMGWCLAMIWTVIFVHVQAHINSFYRAVVIFRKLPVTGARDTLHAVGDASLEEKPTGGEEGRDSWIAVQA